MDATPIEVATPFGTLVAEPCADSDYPGIYVYLRDRNGFELDLALIEYGHPSPFNEGMLQTLVWGDALNEDYTDVRIHMNVDKWIKENDE